MQIPQNTFPNTMFRNSCRNQKKFRHENKLTFSRTRSTQRRQKIFHLQNLNEWCQINIFHQWVSCYFVLSLISGRTFSPVVPLLLQKMRPESKDITRLHEISLMKNTYFGAIHYNIHLDMK